MTWPPRLRLADPVHGALAGAGSLDVERLADAGSQQRALRRICETTPELGEVLGAAVRALGREGAVVLERVPTADAALVVVASAVGTVSAEGNGFPERLVWDVRPAAGGSGAVRSRGTDAFSLHTDSAHQERPHEVVGLACVEPSPDGSGRSMLAPASRVAAALRARGGERLVGLLGDPCFPFASPTGTGRPVRRFAVLPGGAGGHAGVRYRDPLVRWGTELARPPLGGDHRSALEAFQALIAEPSLPTTFDLAANELLVVDNRRVLHGRTAIGAAAGRHLKRLKLHVPGLDVPGR